MRLAAYRRIAGIILSACPAWWAVTGLASDPEAVRDRAERSFDQFVQRNDHHAGLNTDSGSQIDGFTHAAYSPEQYLIGTGQGDMTKGAIVCQRVSELSARADLAKQIRIFVKEHMVDRLRERSGKDAEQDIELTREEIVQEYLEGVKIIDRHVDNDKSICSATAVMPKRSLHSPAPSSGLPPTSPITR